MSFCEVVSCAIILLSLIIALVGLVGNGTVFWLLGFQMRRNAFSVYILNLAGADFLFMCFQIVYCSHIMLDMYYIPIKFPLFSIVVLNIGYLCGMSILSAISIERCLSVMWPIWYRCQRPRHTSAVICTLLWVLALVWSLIEGKECGFLFDTNGPGWCETFDLIATAWLIVLIVVLLGSSLALVINIFCGLYRIPVTRLYVTIVFTVLVFLLCGLPYGIYWFLLEWTEKFNYNLPCGFHPVTVLLSCVNSCANPIIYFLVGSIRHHRFQRKTLKLLLQKAMQDTPEEEECGEMGS
ncbi:mas-related G-protein coupled receptor member X2 [Rattus norvegicus]|uniref:MRGB1 G protein-coupled receptor n=2 Tax=Rattus norvegicus TaxID=10116 RepID=Q7TN48_RAT|nr:mas-related G-protein coupled receptor member X2 [Rattus norvegicus]AAQ08311.1 MRGB1 G protein-coupled receptor [Rattus norvegicus]CDG86245.1 TPA: Mas-related G protein-coupled receptor g6 [Rattus norvegicus]|eukprot:NP_001002280.1 mas-related G-protein coupled receptor member X2 [Rattus norvegicus]